jgi:hypothetical protein
MWQFKTPIACFNYCNGCFFDLFGSVKYESFEAFLNDNNKPLVHYSTPSDTKERDYLLAWFKYKVLILGLHSSFDPTLLS